MWRTVVAGWGVVLVALASGAVERTVPGEFPTIGDALAAAEAGDTILVGPGTYEEPIPGVTGVAGLTLRGNSTGQTVIQGPASAERGMLLTADHAEDFVVEDIVFQHIGAEKADLDPESCALAVAVGGSVVFRRCTFQNSAGCGLGVSAGRVVVESCRFLENAGAGVYVEDQGAVVRVVGSEFRGNGAFGIGIHNVDSVEVAGCTCNENGEEGILLSKAPCGAVLRKNTCADNGSYGIFVNYLSSARVEDNEVRRNDSGIVIGQGSHAEVSGNIVENNRGLGIGVLGAGSSGNVVHNAVCENEAAGILFALGAEGTARNNRCVANRDGGIIVERWFTSAELTDNECFENLADGILFQSGCSGSAAGNVCRDNEGFGILVQDEGTAPEIGENTCEGNGTDEIGQIPGVRASRQHQMAGVNTGNMLLARCFDELEELASRLRQHKCRAADGRWQLPWFYWWFEVKDFREDSAHQDLFLETLQAWLEAAPESATARTVSAKVHLILAREARAKETPDETGMGYREHLEEAERLLNEARKMPEKDPETYVTLIEVGRRLRYPGEKLDAIVEEGTAVDKTYLPLYEARVEIFLQTRGGRLGGAEDFIARVAEDTREEMGEQMYALLVDETSPHVYPPDIMAGRFCVWRRVNQGFEELRAAFPEAKYYHAAHAYMACLYGDRPTAKRLLDELGDDVDTRRFGGMSSWLQCKSWAEGLAETPFGDPDSLKGKRVLPTRRYVGQACRMFAIGVAGLAVAALAALAALFAIEAHRRRQAQAPPPLS